MLSGMSSGLLRGISPKARGKRDFGGVGSLRTRWISANLTGYLAAWGSQASRRRRILAGGILIVLFTTFIFSNTTCGSKGHEEETTPQVPVILVHGLASSPTAAWGAPADLGPASSRWWENRSGRGNGRAADAPWTELAGCDRPEEAPGWPSRQTSSRPPTESDGLYPFLVRAGYVPGRTLFLLDYEDDNNGDYILIARERLAPFIERVKAVSGSPWVDVVAHSMGGLVTRFYVAEGGGASLRNVILLGTPNHGSFAANILAELAVTRQYDEFQSKHPGVWFQGATQAREPPAPSFSEGLDGTFPRERPSAAEISVSGQREDPGGKCVQEQPLSREALLFLHERVQLYLPRLVQYLLQERFGPANRTNSPTRLGSFSFKSYFPWRYQQDYQAFFRQGQRYPLALSLAGLAMGGTTRTLVGEDPVREVFTPGMAVPQDIWALSRAYFETLALDLTAYSYQYLWRGENVLVAEGWEGDGREEKGTLTTLPPNFMAASARVLAWLAERLMSFLGSEAVSVALRDQALETSGWLRIRPSSVAINRLLLEQVEFPVASPGKTGWLTSAAAGGNWNGAQTSRDASRFEALQGNLFLAGWNNWEARERKASPKSFRAFPGIKYVTIAGGILNPWQLVWPQVQENDSVVEVGSTLLPWQRDDVFYLWRGSVSSNHLALTRRKDVQQQVLRHLRDYFPIERQLVPTIGWNWWRFDRWARRGSLEVTQWQPTYLSVDSRALKGHSGRVTVEIPRLKLPSDSNLQVWVYGSRGEGWFEVLADEWEPGGPLKNEKVPRLQIEGFGSAYDRLLVGFRLRLDHRPPWPKERGGVYFQVTFSPEEKALEDGTTAITAGAGQGPDEASDDLWLRRTKEAEKRSVVEEGRGLQPGSVGHSNLPWVSPPYPDDELGNKGFSSRPDWPLVEVRGVNRNTAERKEDRTHHQYWEWQLNGAGIPFVDKDGGLISEATLNFTKPGQYYLEARSISNKSDLLRHVKWTVEIKPEDLSQGRATRGFELETAREPRADLDIQGPRKWITGLPAPFKAKAEITWPNNGVQEAVTLYPGREFYVVFDKPGKFPVTAAVQVKVRYHFPERTYVLSNTYIKKVWVEVVTTGTSD